MIMFHIKKFIVSFLENLCTWTGHRWCQTLALRSSILDEKWNTGVWNNWSEMSDVNDDE